MSELMNFIRENYLGIIVVVSVVLLMLVIISVKGLNLNEPKPESKLVQQVTVYS
jgi:hypothetical protein